MLKKTQSYSNLQGGFPVSKKAGGWCLKNKDNGHIEQGVFKSFTGSMLDLHEHQMGDVNIPSKKVTPMTKRYRFFKDDYHGVVANLNLIEKNNTLVADGNFSACVYIGDKIYSINGEFEDHKIIAIESKDSMFPGDLKQLIGKPGHYVVHDFLEKKFNESINSTKQFGKHFDITKMLMLTSLLGFSMVITISCLLSLSRSQQVDIN